MIKVGENRGLINTLMIKSTRKASIKYFRAKKLWLKIANKTDKKANTKNIPAAARISRSLSTGISYPSTSSPNLISLLIVYSFWVNILILMSKSIDLF